MATAPGVGRIEAAALASWPALETVTDGAWIWRFAAGYTKRSNSIQVLDPADDADAAGRLAVHAARSIARGIAPVVRVTPLTLPTLIDHLDAAGWTAFDRSLVLAGPLAGGAPDDAVETMSAVEGRWLAAHRDQAGLDAASAARLAAIVAAIRAPAVGLILAHDGRPAASALAVVSDGILGLTNVVTAPSARRRGLMRRLIGAAFAWGEGEGAEIASLQVFADNAPALALYHGFGLKPVYGYHYRGNGELRR